MKTAKLIGRNLDWAVAKCMGLKYPYDPVFRPSTNWAHGGPIFQHQRISIKASSTGGWVASCHPNGPETVITNHGSTPLIAAMRCYVASTLGADIDVPEELT